MRVDLHMHSCYSDGDLSPTELVDRAVRLGLDAVALTDHDTDAGVEEFCRAGSGKIRTLRGVELSAYCGTEVHILGYGCPLSARDPDFKQVVSEFAQLRVLRVKRFIERLQGIGVDVTFEDIRAYPTKTPTRLHLARVLVKKGYAVNERDAYRKFLGADNKIFVSYDLRAPETAVRAVVDAGGVAVLAHPGRIGLPQDRLEELILKLKDEGLSGIEAHYPRHTKAQTQSFQRLAKRLDLFCTNGSDFHRAKGVHAQSRIFTDTVLDPRAQEALGL